jgi:hypothetical protein
LAAGNYTVTATDGNGCTEVGSVTVTNPNAPTVATIVPTPALCNGGNGSVTVAVTGGTPTYSYLWSNGGSNATVTGPAGAYTVTITDAAGCVVTGGPATITQPSPMSAVVSNTQESAPGANDGSATVVASGGTPPYSYAWSNGGTSATINGIGAGTYTVTVTDGNGCTSTGSTSVVVGLDDVIGQVTFGAYPNPNDGMFHVMIGTVEPTDINVQICDMMGKVVYSNSEAFATEYKREVNLTGQAAGIYFIRMKAGDVSRTYKIEIKH